MPAIRSLALLVPALSLLLGAGPGVRVVVRGQGTALGETPIVVALQAPIEVGRYGLKSGQSPSIPATVYRDGETSYLAATLGNVPAEGGTAYELVTDTSDKSASGIATRPEGKALDITIDGRPFATYLPESGPKPVFFPLIGPTGRPFTRAFPMREVPGEKRDHPHHRSMWFTHGKVNGVDFWSEEKGHGSIVEKSRLIVPAQPAIGLIRTTDDWVAPDGKVVCTDERVVRFYATKGARILDFDVTIKASAGPAAFGDTKEGMLGVRVATSMDVTTKRGGKIINADGLTDDDAWGKPATWVDYSGPVDGQTVGIAILNHPGSFRHPTTWHVRTYGLFAANPFGWHDFGKKESGDHTIPAGGSIRFGYRVILHEGDAASANLPAAYSAYSKPPTVEIRTD